MYIAPWKTDIPYMKAFFEKQDRRRFQWHKDLEELEQLFSLRILRKIVNGIYDDMIIGIEKKIAGHYSEYMGLAKQNIPYAERVNGMKKVEILEIHLVRIKKERANYKIRPLREWLQEGDEKLMRKIGSRRFISLFLDLAVING